VVSVDGARWDAISSNCISFCCNSRLRR
jgi:hypothetical protein